MTFRLFGIKISIERSKSYYFTVDEAGFKLLFMEYSYAKKFLKKVEKTYSRDQVSDAKVPAIKMLRELTRSEIGGPLNLRQANEFVKRYYKLEEYNEK